jgi:3-methyladenine DNA glycosylase Tag
MMEDSYEISIIEFLADEFTEKLLNDPSIIRNQIINEIKSMIDKKNGVTSKDVNPQITDSVTTKETSVSSPVVKKNNRKKQEIASPPSPPKSRLLKEGKEPEPPKNMNVQ